MTIVNYATDTSRPCSKCGEQHARRKRNGTFHSYCNACMASYMRDYYAQQQKQPSTGSTDSVERTLRMLRNLVSR